MESAPLPEVTWHRRASWVYIASMKIDLASQLALIAAGGILLGACGGNEPQANNPAPSTDPSAMGAMGATGAKLTVQLIDELERRGGRYGMVTMCIGGGMGAAGIFERL